MMHCMHGGLRLSNQWFGNKEVICLRQEVTCSMEEGCPYRIILRHYQICSYRNLWRTWLRPLILALCSDELVTTEDCTSGEPHIFRPESQQILLRYSWNLYLASIQACLWKLILHNVEKSVENSTGPLPWPFIKCFRSNIKLKWHRQFKPMAVDK